MFSSKTPDELELLFGFLPLAHAVVKRDDDAQWQLFWHNAAAQAIWGDYALNDDLALKLELMDAMTRASASTFLHTFHHALEAYRFTASPEQNALLVSFLPESQRKSEPVLVSDALNTSLYQWVVEGANFGVFDWNVAQDFIHYSQRAYTILDIAPAQLGSSQASLMAHVHPADSVRVSEALAAHFDEHWPFDVEFRVRNQHGSYNWLQVTAQSIWDDAHRLPIRVAGTLVDISARKQAQQQVQQKEALIEQIIDALPISIYVKDGQGCFRFFSKQTERDTGVSRAQAIGRTDYEIFPLDLAHQHLHGDQVAKEENRLIISEESLLLNGEPRWLMMGKGPIKVERPERTPEVWILGFSLDITQRKAMEEMLKTARQDAESSAKAKADFLSVMSHEIRTPLNSVIGTSGLLLDSDLDDEQGQYVEMIKRSGEHLLYLINDILDFNKLDAGKVELEQRVFELEQPIKTVIDMSSTQAKLKHLTLSYSLDASLPKFYKGDEARLRQILLNLVGNAIKFTYHGHVTVKLLAGRDMDEFGHASSGGQRVRFEVQDTGMGIPQKSLTKLFSEFTQVDASTTRQHGGTGLGLSISKRLVEAMKGEIGIISELGKGSVFWFEIPFNLPNVNEVLTENSEQELEDARPLSILVAEDNASNQLLIKAILSKLGHRVSLADNGLKAVELVQTYGDEFDLVLMDMQMPIMDGISATQAIRLLDSRNANIPIVALTANAMDGDRARVLQAGMNDYLSKPIDIQALKRALAVWSLVSR
ncbi:PAS domain-containing hybrid sensor histidine kinase/response regulator [Thiomicrorhabdus aquaedulcis]|uniref:PAS domain-containing hybrid sensor histidine kinase/response regulator n=1 Tax=Thiomicrorhabdus aquaedulcis TaxID=2211106 RepID=UPI001561D6C4|nr:ATP-binding protein [Thiomicrorhabdus aquaedulcis]